jgi:hypothetical protein
MSGRKHRDKGNRVEREIVGRLRALGIHAERYPLSGASRFRGLGHDLDVYPFGKDAAPLVGEVKARKDGAGSSLIKRWIGTNDFLVTKENNAEPIVHLPWRTLELLLQQRAMANGKQSAKSRRAAQPEKSSWQATTS